MIANNYFSDDKDLQLIFTQLIDWETIVRETEGENFLITKFIVILKTIVMRWPHLL